MYIDTNYGNNAEHLILQHCHIIGLFVTNICTLFKNTSGIVKLRHIIFTKTQKGTWLI